MKKVTAPRSRDVRKFPRYKVFPSTLAERKENEVLRISQTAPRSNVGLEVVGGDENREGFFLHASEKMRRKGVIGSEFTCATLTALGLYSVTLLLVCTYMQTVQSSREKAANPEARN